MGDEVASLKQQVQALKAKLAKDSETKKKLRTHVDLLKEKAINLGVIVTELQSVKQDKAALQQECERLSAALAGEQQRVQESVQREQLTAQQKSQKEQQFFDLAREKQQLQSRWAAHDRELQQLQKQLHEAVQECEQARQQSQAAVQEKQEVLVKLEHLQQQWQRDWQLVQSAIQQLQQQQRLSTSNTRQKTPEQLGQQQQQQQPPPQQQRQRQLQRVSQEEQPSQLLQQQLGAHQHLAVQDQLQQLRSDLDQLRQCQQQQQQQHNQQQVSHQELQLQLQEVQVQLHELRQCQQEVQQQRHLQSQVQQLHLELQRLQDRYGQHNQQQLQPTSQQQFVDLQQEVQQLRAQVYQQRQQIGQLQQQCSQVTREYSRWRHCLGAMIQPDFALASTPGSQEPQGSRGLTPVVASAGGTREPSPAAAGTVTAAAAAAHAAAIGQAVAAAAAATARAGNCSAAVSRAGQERVQPAPAAVAAAPLRAPPGLAPEQARGGSCMFGTTTLAVGGSSSSYSGQDADGGDHPAGLPLLRQSSSPTVAGRLQLQQHSQHGQHPHHWQQQQQQVISPSQSPADLSIADGNPPHSSAGSGDDDDDDVIEPALKRQRSEVTPPAAAQGHHQRRVPLQQQQQHRQPQSKQQGTTINQQAPDPILQPKGSTIQRPGRAEKLLTVWQPQQHVLQLAPLSAADAAAADDGAAAGMPMSDLLAHLQNVKAGHAQPAAAAQHIADAVAGGCLQLSELLSGLCSSFLEVARSNDTCYVASHLEELLLQPNVSSTCAPSLQQQEQHWKLVSLMAYAGWSQMPLTAAAAASQHLAEMAVHLAALLSTEQGQQQQQQQQDQNHGQQPASEAGLGGGDPWDLFGHGGVLPWSEVLMGCYQQQQQQELMCLANHSSSSHLIGSLIKQLTVPVWSALAAPGGDSAGSKQQRQQQAHVSVSLACAACSAVASLCRAANDAKGFQGFVARLVDRIARTLSSGCESKRNVSNDCQTAMVGSAAAACTGATATAGIAGTATAAVVAGGAVDEVRVAPPAGANGSKLLGLACLVAAVASWPRGLLLERDLLQQCIQQSVPAGPVSAPPPAAAAAADREAWLWQCAVSQPVLLALQAALAAVAQGVLLAAEQGAAWGSSSSSPVLLNSPVTNAFGCDDGLAQSTARLCGASTCAQTVMFIVKQLALAQQAANAQQHEADRGQQRQQRQHHQPEADSVHGAFECSAPSLEQLVPMLLGLLQHLLHQRCQQKQQVRQAGSGHKGARVSQAERALAGALCAALKLATAALPKAAVQQLLCSPLEDILQTTAGTAAPAVKSTGTSQAVATGAVCAASPVTAAAADCAGGNGSSDVNNHVKSVVRQLQQVVGDASCAITGEQHI